jgi:hypothetical protein
MPGASKRIEECFLSHRPPLFVWLCGLSLLFVTHTVRAAPSVDELAAVIWRYNESVENDLPLPDAEQLERLLAGEMVDIRDRTPIEDWRGKPQDKLRVVGYKLVERPRLLVWLATLNVTTEHSRRMREYQLSDDGAGGSVWYQHLNTPWPVRNRHWVIANRKNTELAEATQGLVWEHRWDLAERGKDEALNLLLDKKLEGLGEKDFDKSIYLTVNEGAWTMFAVNEQTTLVAAHTTADMGGWIPERWVSGFVAKQLGSVLANLTTRADTVHDDYSGEQTVFDGWGRPITPRHAADVRRRYHLSQERSAKATDDGGARRE